MRTQHLMSLPADAPEWAWTPARRILDRATGVEINSRAAARRPAAIAAHIGEQAWLVVTFDVAGNAEVLGFTAVRSGTTPDLSMITSALDRLGRLR